MRREQDLERELQFEKIENIRLRDEVAQLKKQLARIYNIASLSVMHTPPIARRGRRLGSTRIDERVFAKTLFDAYSELPPDRQNRDEVARALGISIRTLRRYLDRYDILWPPTDHDTLEQVLQRLALRQSAGQTEPTARAANG